MADIRALLSSRNQNYCTPPEVVRPMRRLLIPKGCGRKLMDPASNGASIVGAHLTADGVAVDGLELRPSWPEHVWYQNPPYDEIERWTEWQAHCGRVLGVPGLSLIPARTDTKWARRDIFGSADAILFLDGRLTFWVPIPLHRRDAAEPAKDKEPYYLRRWYPDATDETLPAPFRRLSPGMAIGPELGENGRPQAAPFPSMIPFWADPETVEPDLSAELAALRELVRSAAGPVLETEGRARDRGATGPADACAAWLARAEQLAGVSPDADSLPLQVEVLDALARAGGPVDPHAVSVRAFARRFGGMGTLVVARGRHKGVHRLMAA